MFRLGFFVAVVVPVLSRPQAQQNQLASANAGSTPVPIISQTEEINPDGSFKFSFETANGIKVDESGYLKDNPESSTDRIQVIEGSISYTDEGGHMINLRYVADENGYQPQGDHLPTAPPVPEDIARSLQGQSQQPNNAVQPGGQLSSQHPGNVQQQNEFAPQHAGNTQAQAQLTNGPQ
ncbi:unnamed protein product [Acanthoscelides obtectus]|uniref:Uncharacterized protein n=1 Tax=Acanthoscelides obtectus TaxID=200917 RepID=A0A9P0PGY5_ACAOB|nr:unnamed protein product [Acanthoscelides obtectus]CAK1677657.1 hypothetical protein AOBTE_LOCUS31467 [Acanthoscelides obtectus]